MMRRADDARADNFEARLLEGWLELKALGVKRTEAARTLGTSAIKLWRLENPDKRHRKDAGRKPALMPTPDELALVRSIYVRLNESRVRGRGMGSSKVEAYRLAASSANEAIGEAFRRVILRRRSRSIPPSWERLLDVPSSVLDSVRDKKSTMSAWVSTPRGRTFIDAAGQERELLAGCIFESDDGTVNFPVWIPWPYKDDRCSQRFGVRVGRFQLLPIVDVRTRLCVAWHYIIRSKSSYRAEDIVALFGDCFGRVGIPEAMRLERGSWESTMVRSALELAGVRTLTAWESKQKNAVESWFDRIWTPLSLLPGDVGRTRGENVENTKCLMACEEGRRDPRECFCSAEQAVAAIGNAVSYVNGDLHESDVWGKWIPQQLYAEQTQGRALPLLKAEDAILFSREQRVWTVRKGCVGGRVATPMLEFPVYFQCVELWEFEGCKVRCFFDPFAADCVSTIVLEDEWRGCKPGHIIAQAVPALEMAPAAILADDYTQTEEMRKSLEVRKAIAKAVRTEKWNFLGHRSAEARDGYGNVSRVDRVSGAASQTAAMVEPRRELSPRAVLSAPVDPATAARRRALVAELAGDRALE
jgi:hypothetical protein